MTATITELETLQEIDLDKEVPCQFEEEHEHVQSQQSAKFRVLTYCKYCKCKKWLNICEPCLTGLFSYAYVEHVGKDSCGLSMSVDECILEVQEL